MKQLIFAISLLICIMLSSVNSSALVVLPDTMAFSIRAGESEGSVFRITPESISSDIEVTYALPFSITFNQTHFTNLSTFFDNEFVISVPLEANAGDYTGKIWIYGEGQTEVIELLVNVPSVLNFSVPEKINNSFSTGDSGVFFINITNLGNAEASISYHITGNIFTIDDLGSFVVYPRMNYMFPVTYYFESGYVPGNYTTNITFASDIISSKIVLETNITDSEAPVISDIRYNPQQIAGEEFIVSFSVSDNKAIDSVWLEYGTSNVINFDSIDSIHYATINLYAIGDKVINIYANDTSGNEAIEKLTITLEPNDIAEVYKINYYEMKAGYSLKKPIFHSDEPIYLKGKLLEINYKKPNETLGEEANIRVALAVPGKEYNLEEGFETDFAGENVTDVDLVFESDWVSDFSLKIQITPPSWVSNEPYIIELDTHVGQYNIPESITKTIGNVVKHCVPNISSENYPDSYWLCEEKYPININPDNMGRFMTSNEYDAIMSECATRLDSMEKTKDVVIFQSQLGFIFLLIIVSILGVFWLFFGRRITYLPWW